MRFGHPVSQGLVVGSQEGDSRGNICCCMEVIPGRAWWDQGAQSWARVGIMGRDGDHGGVTWGYSKGLRGVRGDPEGLQERTVGFRGHGGLW